MAALMADPTEDNPRVSKSPRYPLASVHVWGDLITWYELWGETVRVTSVYLEAAFVVPGIPGIGEPETI